MRLLCFVVLAASLSALPAAGGGASAFSPAGAPSGPQKLVHDAKFVCGMTDEGFKCRSEPGMAGHGKMRPIPGTSSDESSEAPAAPPAGGNEDALPSAPSDWGTSTSTQAPPRAVPATCPNNTELLGGHCVPYTQRCTNGIPPTGYPPQCQGEEKQVCNFHPDGSKDCCCRTYSKY